VSEREKKKRQEGEEREREKERDGRQSWREDYQVADARLVDEWGEQASSGSSSKE